MSGPEQKRFTRDGGAGLEARLEANCCAVVDGVRAVVGGDHLVGIVLGGGYGRGEGGVLRHRGEELPYNDMEFYVFVRGHAVVRERRLRGPLRELGHALSADAGLEVEFKVLTLDKLQGSAVSMFYYDLVAGHRVVFGDPRLLESCSHHLAADRIPQHEATRLLMNRCSGLLFSRVRLGLRDFGEEDSDYVGRNLAKARLAFGDVVLTVLGRYHWSCVERHSRLCQLRREGGLAEELSGIELEPLIDSHAEGVEFKLHPVRDRSTREKLVERHRALTETGRWLWLWVEGRRLGCRFATTGDYIEHGGDKCPEVGVIRRMLVSARAFGPQVLMNRSGWRYPRERLYHGLALLLWGGSEGPVWGDRGVGSMRNADIERLRRELRVGGETTTFEAFVTAYEGLWGRFN